MRMRLLPYAFAGLVAVGGCQDGTGPDGGLTRAEAMVVLSSVLSSSESAGNASFSADGNFVDANGAPPINFTHDVESSHPCPRGGRVHLDFTLSGSFDAETHSAALDLEGGLRHDDCAVDHEGVTLTIDGSPDLEFSAAAAAVNGQPSAPFTFEVNGALNWSTSDGRSGNCTVTVDAVTNFTARTRTVDADVCGHLVKQTTSWS